MSPDCVALSTAGSVPVLSVSYSSLLLLKSGICCTNFFENIKVFKGVAG